MKSWQTSCIPNSKHLRTFAALAVLVLAVSLLNLCLGAEKIPPVQVLRALVGIGEGTTPFRIVRYVRLPRLCACLLAGGALAASGAIIQGVLSNALAAPSTIGVNAGAGLMVALCCAVAPTAVNLVPLAAMAGAFLGVMTVLLIARRTGASKITLVLAGVAVSSIFSAGIDAVITFVPEALNGYSDFRIGGFSGVSMARILPALWPAVLSFIASLSLHNEMDGTGPEPWIAGRKAAGDPAGTGGSFSWRGCQCWWPCGICGPHCASYHAQSSGRGERPVVGLLRSGRCRAAGRLRPAGAAALCTLRNSGGHRHVPGGRPLLHLAAAKEGAAP